MTSRSLITLLVLAAGAVAGEGEKRYTNPIIQADYSDPDVIRVGDDFYMVSSSFGHVPGLPVLHSRDLVHWELIGHALERLPARQDDRPQHGNGVWAPSIRYHQGAFWIYYGDPDTGLYLIKSRNAAGPWDPPLLVRAAKGWIDPCPLWDDDGQAWLVHAWAKSRVGFNSILTLHRMSSDGTRIHDEGTTVFDGHAHHPTIEGPKLYKRDGWYYIFAPAGGVKPGWQTVLRSRSIQGPYEDRVVLEQGSTAINGPHQGGWVETPAGESWFIHFQDRGAYGRIIHLQPVRWQEGWPQMGVDKDGNGIGEPVNSWPVPALPEFYASIPSSDEFSDGPMGLQWQWQANIDPSWSSLTASPGSLRLYALAQASPANLWLQPNIVAQKFPAESFTVVVRMETHFFTAGERAGLIIFGSDYACLCCSATTGGLRIEQRLCKDAEKGGGEEIVAAADIERQAMYLKSGISAGGRCSFSYSVDGIHFTAIGEEFLAFPGKWVGARIGLFASRIGEKVDTIPAGITGSADFDYIHFMEDSQR
jgi:beta-xylosidase